MHGHQGAERRARDLLRAHGVSAPPVEVEALAAVENIAIDYQDLGPTVSGLVVRGPDGRATIGVNALHPPNRRRFTIAHEIGHHLLHSDSATLFVDELMVHFRDAANTAKADPREMEANAFAAALLMPEDWLRADLRDRKIDLSDDVAVRNLATRYQVSQQALTFRLMNLNLLEGLPETTSVAARKRKS